ncbi:MAG: helix-turn-helix domain-containing protein [Candidatus Scatosoma sp.]
MKISENYAICLSKTLKELRRSFSYTQRQVAEKLNITYQSYQAYERQTALPSLPVFIALAELYDVSMDFLIGRKEY